MTNSRVSADILLHYVCIYTHTPESTQPRNMENTCIEEDTRNSVHKTKIPQCPSKKAPWDLTQFSQLPSAAPLYVPNSHQQSEISSLSKMILVLGKARSHGVPNLDCRGAEAPG